MADKSGTATKKTAAELDEEIDEFMKERSSGKKDGATVIFLQLLRQYHTITLQVEDQQISTLIWAVVAKPYVVPKHTG